MYCSWVKPNAAVVNTILDTLTQAAFTYPEVGASRLGGQHQDTLSRHYHVLHRRYLLGTGETVYQQAKAAFARWQMYQLPWVAFCWPEIPLVPDTNMVILANVLGLWWINVCRVVYTMQEEGAVERFGFAVGSLQGNTIRGEERVFVEWNRRDDAVYYDFFSFSKANLLVTKLSGGYLRILQERFARESAQVIHDMANGRRKD
ncbi:MAG: DUF1990 domain-containing protein [Magnetococcales bacterium]|nr:DUF1990 domain-containing protein [Magnetococcales bacterium]